VKTWTHNNRSAWLFFALAIVLHVVLIMVPLAQKRVATIAEHHSVKVRLVSPAKPKPEMQPPATAVEWPEAAVPALEELPRLPGPVSPPVKDIVQNLPSPSSKRVLSSQFDFEGSIQPPVFGPPEQKESARDFYFRQRPSLETVLNQPSLQLPFEDTRTYLVASYDDGLMGGMERFWDSVSVPFGFTTRNNTRVQCVWVLFIAGCGWGHKTLFYQPARYREHPNALTSGNSQAELIN